MIGLDTNALVRYFSKDDLQQGLKASQLINALTPAEPGWVSLTTLIELVWVVTRKLRGDRKAMIAILDQLQRREDIVIEQSATVASAFQQYRHGRADFADCLIAASARAAGCARTVTFDRVAARDAGMELIP